MRTLIVGKSCANALQLTCICAIKSAAIDSANTSISGNFSDDHPKDKNSNINEITKT